MRKISNLMLDWNGTLSDDHPLIFQTVTAIFKTLGVKPISFQKFKAEFKLPYMEFYSKYTVASKEVLDEIFLREIKKYEHASVFKEVPETLKYLHMNGVNMAILSSHPQEKLEAEIRANNLEHFFKEICGGVPDKNDAISSLADRNGFQKGFTAYMGDMIHDIEAGKAAGVTTIAITWGYHTEAQLRSAGPDFIVSNIKELRRMM